jgi:hypothetical protein
MRTRLEIYATMAKWPILCIWWAAAARIFLLVAGERLGLPWHHTVCDSPYCDVSAFWEAGRMAAAGRAAATYDPVLFTHVRQALFGSGAEILPWFYPPPTLLLVAGLAPFPLALAYWVWIVALTGGAVLLLRGAGVGYAVIAAGLLSPASLWTLELGQFGLLSGAALVAALLAPKRLVAGLALGVLIFKPHGGLLAPFALLVGRYWRTVAVACLVGASLVLASFVIFGVGTWQAYFGPGMAMAKGLLVRITLAPGTAAFGANVFGMMNTFGAPVPVALAVQLLSSVAALVAVLWLWRRCVVSRLLVLRTVYLSMLAMPYGGVDYFVSVSLALALCVQARGWRFSLTDALLFTWPALSPVVYGVTGWQVTPLLLCFALWRSGGSSPPETAPVSAGRAADAPAGG